MFDRNRILELQFDPIADDLLYFQCRKSNPNEKSKYFWWDRRLIQSAHIFEFIQNAHKRVCITVSLVRAEAYTMDVCKSPLPALNGEENESNNNINYVGKVTTRLYYYLIDKVHTMCVSYLRY